MSTSSSAIEERRLGDMQFLKATFRREKNPLGSLDMRSIPDAESSSVTVWIFIVRIVRQWGALATGGVIVGAVWFGNGVLGWHIPWFVDLALAVGFLGVAAFRVWLEGHLKVCEMERRPLRPIEIRNRLDQFVTTGRRLLDAWMRGKGVGPTAETQLFEGSITEFVERHFTVKQNDAFRGHITRLGVIFEVALALPKETNPEAHAAAQLLAKRIEALEQLRPQIVD
jgi:hypothetical protein